LRHSPHTGLLPVVRRRGADTKLIKKRGWRLFCNYSMGILKIQRVISGIRCIFAPCPAAQADVKLKKFVKYPNFMFKYI
jgi:hypothetical protein